MLKRRVKAKQRRRRKQRELPKPIVAAASPRGIRTPVTKPNPAFLLAPTYKRITIGQLSVLLWCLYRVANDESLGYLDADLSMQRFLATKLSKEMSIATSDLERLLFAGNVADTMGFFWSPDGKSFTEFISALMSKEEVFDRQWNLILTPGEGKRIRDNMKRLRKIIK